MTKSTTIIRLMAMVQCERARLRPARPMPKTMVKHDLTDPWRSDQCSDFCALPITEEACNEERAPSTKLGSGIRTNGLSGLRGHSMSNFNTILMPLLLYGLRRAPRCSLAGLLALTAIGILLLVRPRGRDDIDRSLLASGCGPLLKDFRRRSAVTQARSNFFGLPLGTQINAEFPSS
jgi:hypothetical protein